MALLDTTVYIDLNGRGGRHRAQEVEAVIRQLLAAGEMLVTSRINVAELYVGVDLSKDAAAEQESIDNFLAWVGVVEFTDQAARSYAQIRADLQRRGRLVGDMDMLIGGAALAHGHSVVTRNGAHFNAMPGVKVIRYGS